MVPAQPASPTNATDALDASLEPVWEADGGISNSDLDQLLGSLESAYGQDFTVLDLATGRIERVSADWLGCDLFSRIALCEEVARRGSAEVIEDCAPLLLLAVPLSSNGEPTDLVAVGAFLTDRVGQPDQIAAAASTFGVSTEQALRWAKDRQVWPPLGVQSLAQAWLDAEVNRQKATQLKAQLVDVSANLLSTFEELSMLHRLTERLSLSSTENELCELSLQWLADIVPAEGLVAMLEAPHNRGEADGPGVTDVLTWGRRFMEEDDYPEFIQRLGPDASSRCLVLDRDRTASPTWCYPDIREVISVPIRSGDRVLGWLVALNYSKEEDALSGFGAIEASLLSSVAAILGVHSGNIDLYREKSEFFESVIRALSSSIDAKDPYTCGHSDRVARISVCLAKQLGCDEAEQNTIYLSGLLHDIGKIGIDDNVLRKPGKLTDEEYEHIKTHPELGHQILKGVKQLDSVLPVVLHHHEAWDGGGYPAGLKGEECPRLARIVAVADSIDAMGSDRPYRKGMPAEKLDGILSAGAGRQWDPDVVEAYFQVRDEVRRIEATDREALSLDVREWVSKHPE